MKKEMPQNTNETITVNKTEAFHHDGQTKKLKKVIKRRLAVTTTGNEEESKVSNNEADGESDTDEINIILPSIEEQRKFAEAAYHITSVQEFQKVLDRHGLGDVMRKYYVLDYRDVWARVAGRQYQGFVGRGMRRRNWRGRGRGWNR